jgi:hypothetical protein
MFSRIVTQWLVMRARSSRRKSPWNLLLVPLFVVWFATIAYALLRGMEPLYVALNSTPPERLLSGSVGGVMVFAGVAIAALVPAFILANVTVWLIPGARRAMDCEAAEYPEAGFRASTLGLLRGALVTVPVGIVIAALGVWLM